VFEGGARLTRVVTAGDHQGGCGRPAAGGKERPDSRVPPDSRRKEKKEKGALGYFVGRTAALGREWEREKEGQQPARACGLTRKRRRWASWAERKGKGERERGILGVFLF
jgi:hypothetical protein